MRTIAGRMVVVCVLGVAASAACADVPLYVAAVPMNGSTEADRAAGFGEALKVAAVRASGRREAATAPKVVAAAAAPTTYVQQYSTTADRMLKVGFDGKAMEQLLQQAGLPLWPAERPITTALLFVPGVASGARAVLASERPPERIELEHAAQARGVPLEWPSVPFDAASARAQLASVGSSQAVLVGLGQGGVYEWSFAHAGQVVQDQGSMADGIDFAADRLAARYAPASTRGLANVDLRIGGVDNVREYAALTSYLEGLSLVRSLGATEYVADTVRFALAVRGDADLLGRVFALDGRLAPAPRDDGTPADAPDFIWRP